MSEKTTEYICCSCYKPFRYQDLLKMKTIVLDKEHKYTHLCPNCKCTKFRILSIVIHN